VEQNRNDSKVIMEPEENNIEVSTPAEVIKYKKRSAWAAFLLALAGIGVGYIYCGDLKKGIRILILFNGLYLLILAFLKFVPNLFFLIAYIVILIPFLFYIIIDSITITLKKKEYVLKKYNRWYIYTGTIVFVNIIYVFPLGYLIPETYGTPTGSMEKTVLIGDRLIGNDAAYGIKYPLTEKYIMHYKKPERNEVVYFKFPGLRDEIKPSDPVKFLKRIAGVPGDTIQIIDKKLYVNGMQTIDPKGTQYIMKNVLPQGEPSKDIFPKGSGWNADNYGPLYIPKQGNVIRLNVDNINSWITFIQREDVDVRIQGVKIFINGEDVSEYKVKHDYYFVLGDNRDNALDSRYWGFVPEENIMGKITMVYFSWDINIPLMDFSKRVGSIRWNRIGTIIE